MAPTQISLTNVNPSPNLRYNSLRPLLYPFATLTIWTPMPLGSSFRCRPSPLVQPPPNPLDIPPTTPFSPSGSSPFGPPQRTIVAPPRSFTWRSVNVQRLAPTRASAMRTRCGGTPPSAAEHKYNAMWAAVRPNLNPTMAMASLPNRREADEMGWGRGNKSE